MARRFVLPLLILLSLIGLLVSCYDPDLSKPGRWLCPQAKTACPDDLVCIDGVCQEKGTPPRQDGGQADQ